MEDPVEKTVEGTIEGTIEDTINEVKDEDDIKLAAKKLADSDEYPSSNMNKDNSGNQDGAKDPMSPENITKHEPTAVNRVQDNRLIDEEKIRTATQDTNVAIQSDMDETIDWEKVTKKEARGLDDYDFGEVQQIDQERVITKKGVIDADKFYLPRNKVVRFDGHKLWFEISKDEANAYKHSEIIDWEKVTKKEARGLDDYDLGEVQEVNQDVVKTKRGVVDKDEFYLPRSKALRFEDNKLWFEISKDEAKAYKHD